MRLHPACSDHGWRRPVLGRRLGRAMLAVRSPSRACSRGQTYFSGRKPAASALILRPE